MSFRLSTEQFAYIGADYRRVIEAGTIRVQVGTSSADLPLTATLTLVGPTVDLVERLPVPDRDHAWLMPAR